MFKVNNKDNRIVNCTCNCRLGKLLKIFIESTRLTFFCDGTMKSQWENSILFKVNTEDTRTHPWMLILCLGCVL